MKRLAACALVAAICALLSALPAIAQRGGGHGGGHASGGGFHSSGGFHSAPARSFGSPARSSAYPAGRARAPLPSYRRTVPGNVYSGSGYPNHDRDRHRRAYRSGYPYLIAPYYGYPGYGLLGYPDDTDTASQSDQSAAAPPDNGIPYADYGAPYDAPLPEPGQQAFRTPYQPIPAPPAQLAQEAVILVYKDGRPPEQIHNYILTPTTLYVQDQQYRAIPTSQLDLVATAKANQDAGVSFQIPNSAH